MSDTTSVAYDSRDTTRERAQDVSKVARCLGIFLLVVCWGATSTVASRNVCTSYCVTLIARTHVLWCPVWVCFVQCERSQELRERISLAPTRANMLSLVAVHQVGPSYAVGGSQHLRSVSAVVSPRGASAIRQHRMGRPHVHQPVHQVCKRSRVARSVQYV
jgi:hypothetical protein